MTDYLNSYELCPACKVGTPDLADHASKAHGVVRLSDGLWYAEDFPITWDSFTCQECLTVTEAARDYRCPCYMTRWFSAAYGWELDVLNDN